MPVLVVDAQSTDGTVAVASAHGAQVVVRRWEGFVRSRLLALAGVQTPWTLMLDADEALDAQLRDAIAAAPPDVDGYWLSRTTYYCGKPLRMWTGERVLRLFRTDRVRLRAEPAGGGNAELHERWVCEGPAGELPGTLLHFSYPTAQSYREKFDRYTQLESQGVHPSRAAALREASLVLPRFLWYAVARKAALDGGRGLTVAWFSALYPAVVRARALK